MFQIWLENDTDPTPENLLYTLEGLQLLDLTKDIFWTIGFLFLHKKEIKKNDTDKCLSLQCFRGMKILPRLA